VPEPMVHLAAGTDHACAVTMSGVAYCWGEAANGRLGNAAAMSSAQGRPLLVAGLGELAQIGAGAAHTCALTRQRTIVCWGASNYGQAGVGPGTTPTAPTPMAGLTEVSALAIGGDHSCAVVAGGMVRCWGRGDAGQLGFGTTASGTGLTQPVAIESFGPATSVSAAASHSCAIVSGTAHCWGANRWGQLGNGKTTNANRPTPVMKVAGAVAVDGGDRHSCAVLADGTATCWGSNQYGQLGNGAPLERPTPAKLTLDCP
jgi:alpha-tubulin suppressor-like RCC1 family protein